ncbi:hypothetical protein BDQ17DRAFT_1437566 [Cyathus striatus]|nr:hypothetical protein BDQ17DRAFT_1437566 [Cyathus striatus]
MLVEGVDNTGDITEMWRGVMAFTRRAGQQARPYTTVVTLTLPRPHISREAVDFPSPPVPSLRGIPMLNRLCFAARVYRASTLTSTPTSETPFRIPNYRSVRKESTC